jgi:hypothetical protein
MEYIDEIIKIVGDKNIFTDRVECLCYSRDMSVHQVSLMPLCFHLPQSSLCNHETCLGT